MATRRYKISAGEQSYVVEEVGAAVNSDTVELTVELSTSAITEGSGTRGIKKSEVLEALKKLENYIVSHQWPPA